MKNARHPQMQMTSALNSADFTSAQNLSKYAKKVMSRTMTNAVEQGFTLETKAGQVFLRNRYGMQKAFDSVEAVSRFMGGVR